MKVPQLFFMSSAFVVAAVRSFSALTGICSAACCTQLLCTHHNQHTHTLSHTFLLAAPTLPPPTHRSAVRRKEYGPAAAAYEAALSLNPLYPDVWFSLGYCYLQLDQTQKALQVHSMGVLACMHVGVESFRSRSTPTNNSAHQCHHPSSLQRAQNALFHLVSSSLSTPPHTAC